MLAEFRVRNRSTTHDTDEKIAWMWHRLRALDERFWRGRTEAVRRKGKSRAKKNNNDDVEEPRASKRPAAGGRSGGTWTPLPPNATAATSSDSSSDHESAISPESDDEEVMQRVILASSQRGTHVPFTPSPLQTAVAGGHGTTTGTVKHNPMSTSGSVLVVQGNRIEVKRQGIWYYATVSEVAPDKIKVHYTEGTAEQDEWIKVDSGRMQNPWESRAQPTT